MTIEYEDKIEMLNAQMLDNDKKMIVMMLNEVKAILSLTPNNLGCIALEKKLFNMLLSSYNIDKKEMRITT